MGLKIVIDSDHTGLELKARLVEHLSYCGFDIEDLCLIGPGKDNPPEHYDYPLIANNLAEEIKEGTAGFGILICGTGVGMSIVANKIRGVRAGVVYDPKIAPLLKQHNKCNVICLGSRVVGSIEQQIDIVRRFLESDFQDSVERYVRRVDQIKKID